MSILSGLAGGALSFALASPPVKQAIADIDYVLGVNESSRARYNFYRENWASTLYPRNVTHTPIQLSFEQVLQAFNQVRWADYDGDENTAQRVWEWFRQAMRYLAVDVSPDRLPGPETPWSDPPLTGEIEATMRRRLIDMSSAGAPTAAIRSGR